LLKIDSLAVNGIDNEHDPLIHHFTGRYLPEQSGDYYLLHYNFFPEFKKNPFTTEYRFTPIDFGHKASYKFTGTFTLPHNLVPESLPKTVSENTWDNALMISRKVERSGNTLSISVEIILNRYEFVAEEYQMVKGFFKKVEEMFNEPVVLKAK
jgi:hypothetical protein